MRITSIFKTLLAAAVVMTAVTGCSRDASDEPASLRETATLKLYIDLTDSRDRSRAVGDEFEDYKWAANDGEKMHTVRVIVLDAQQRVEHNSLWTLTAADIRATGREFPVKANETKTIILIANEAGKTVTAPDGSRVSAADLFGSMLASDGAEVDVDRLRGYTHELEANTDGDDMTAPLLMSAIHSYTIGNEESYSATFTIHRAAVKYTFRITAPDDEPHTVNAVHIGRAASRQYLFPDADFTADNQMEWSAYRTPADAGADVLSFTRTTAIAAGNSEQVELAPVYLPEGMNLAAGDIYNVGLTVDGIFTGMKDLNWSIPQTPDVTIPMTDLPRGTHVIVDITLNHTDFEIDYTVCLWTVYNIDIPSFN